MGHQDLNTLVKRFKGRFSFLARAGGTRTMRMRSLFAGLDGHMVCRDSWNIEHSAACSQLLDPQGGKGR